MQTIKDGILLSNHHFIAFNKHPGMAVQSLQHKEESLEVKLRQYCKVPLYLIHRIDQPCSGIVLFAQKKESAAALSVQLKDHAMDRVYLALVTVKPEVEASNLSHYLFAHKKSNKSYIVDEHHKEGKLATLSYEWHGETEDKLHLIKVTLKTGRHHQIRAQLGAIGCPISGDIKYGAKNQYPDRSIGLHAWKMSFMHPTDHKKIDLKATLPSTEIWVKAAKLLDTLSP